MIWARLRSARGRLVVWYLAVLAILLAALGTFQSLTLSSYLRSSTADSLRHGAYQELRILGQCYVPTSAKLRENAQTLAGLLGGHDTAVTIVTPGGQALASHGLGPPGGTRPLHLTVTTVRRLIAQAGGGAASTSAALPLTHCPQPYVLIPSGYRRHHVGPEPSGSVVSGNDTLLVAVPLGPPGKVLGYAILGRSLADVNATVGRLLLLFGLGAAAALVIAAVVALPIINRALRPLRRVADTAEAIAGGDLEQRANLAHSHDEIGRLGEAFDTMVDRLQAALSAREQSEEQMRHFLADASHELRTPATVLRGASQVLLRRWGDGPPELAAALSDVHQEAVRLARLIDDLLTLSKLDAGQPLAPRTVQLRPFLREFVEHYGPAWPSRAIRLDAERLDGAAAHVDPEALRRVITNLVDNAARYSHPGGAITLSGEPDGASVQVAVADEGPGLSQEDAERVFDRFYRANKSRSRDSGGTGLGLSIVHGLVEQSGGTITIDTSPDRGTTIAVSLPRAEEMPAASG